MAARAWSRRGGPICRGGSSPSRWSGGWGRRGRGGCWWSARSGGEHLVRGGGEPPAKTEVRMSGQLALVIDEEALVAAAVWETLPPERRAALTRRLACLLARLMEAERDE